MLASPKHARHSVGMAVIAVYSLKGGVGKTTLAVNLAWCAATLSSRRSLLWDLDPQAASSWILGGASGDSAKAVFSRDITVTRQVRPTSIAGLDLISADRSLRGLDRLFDTLDKKKRLAKLLAQLKDHERIILDCPPGLTETADQVLRAADLIVVPVVPSALSERAYDEVVRHLNGRTPVLAAYSMVDRRRTLHRDALERHPDWPVIPMASAIEAMTSERKPIGVTAPRTASAKAFATLWRTIERRLADQ